MADNQADVKADIAINEDTLARIVSDATARILEQETKGDERKVDSPVVNPNHADAKPEVKGERVTRWDLRGMRYVQGVAFSQHSDNNLRNRAGQFLAETGRQYLAMADSQRKEEDEIARNIAKAAFEDRRISAAGLQRVYNLLDDPEEREMLSAAKRTHSSLTGAAGEFNVPKPMLATIYTIIEEYGLAQRLCAAVTLTSKDLELNSIATAPTATWVGENELFTQSDLALGQNTLQTSKLGAVSSITMELEEDQLTPLIPVWLRKVGENIALKLDQSVFIGDGTSTYGGFVGISNMGSVNTFTAGSGDLAPADLVEADFRSTKKLLSTVRRQRAQWVMARVVWDEIEEFESSVGARIVQEMLTSDPRMRFLGFPVNLSEALDNTTTDTANRDFAILGDFSNTLLGFRRGITVETSRDAVLSNSSGVVQVNAFQQDGMLVKISLRVGHQTPTGVQSGYAVLNAPAA